MLTSAEFKTKRKKMQVLNTASSNSSIINETLSSNYVYCRCCLKTGQHSQLLGQEELKMLKEDLSVNLSPSPVLPQYICVNCTSSLNLAHVFRQNVLASEAALIKLIKVQGKQEDILVYNKDPLSTSDPIKIKIEEDDNDGDICSHNGTPESAIESPHQNILDTGKVKTEDIFEDPVIIQNNLDQISENGRIKKELQSELKNQVLDSSSSLQNPALSLEEASRPTNFKITNIHIGGKIEIATEATKIRANITMLLVNSTALPFRFKSNAFQCLFCDNKYGTFNNLKQHIRKDHKYDTNENKIFHSLRKIYIKTIHADISHLKCEICHKIIDNIENLAQHLTQHDVKLYDIEEESKVPSHGIMAYKVDMDGFVCHICDKQFRFLKFLISHMILHYGIYSCPECAKKFVTKIRLNDHSKVHLKDETKCTDCHLTFDTRRLMLNHRYSKHKKKQSQRGMTQCPECPKSFPSTKPVLRFSHMEKVHGIKKPDYVCEVCHKSYKTIHSLNSHARVVHKKKIQFVCDICGYFCAEKLTMDRHVEHHEGVRNFECDFCHKKFRTKGNLRLHLRGHYNDKRFTCRLCDAAFIQKHCLKSHLKSRHPDAGIEVI